MKVDTLTCTCGGAPRTYITESAISLASRVGNLFCSNNSFGKPDASANSVLTAPGLMLCEEIKKFFVRIAKYFMKNFIFVYSKTSIIRTN
jgi:hypothetical protein